MSAPTLVVCLAILGLSVVLVALPLKREVKAQ
jgi:hypothetical protein